MEALSTWRKVDLGNLQKDLDVDAEEITKRRDEAETRRKALVANTKEFRRTSSEEVRNAVAALIKQFQEEVDALSKRSKAAETSFLTVYQRISNAPDPVPILTAAMEAEERAGRTQEHVLENQKLHKTIEEYRAEFAEMKNQEVTIARLKEQLKELETNTEETVNTRVKDKEKRIERQFAAKERELREEQLALATRLGESEQHAAALQSALDALHAEVFEAKARYDEDNGARQSTLDMLNLEVERLQQRCEGLEKELELERERLVQFQTTGAAGAPVSVEQHIGDMSRATLEHELAIKDREIAQLIEDHRAMQQHQTGYKQLAEERIAALETALHAADSQLKEALDKLSKQTDYDEVKSDLLVLRSIEFGSVPGAETRSLEMLLVEKNKSLQSEVTRLRGQYELASETLRDLESKQSLAVSEKDKQAELIARLEGELSNFQSLSLASRGTAEGREGTSSSAAVVPATHEEVLTGSQTKDASDTILTIVSSQRDRFRQRNLELEAESRHQQQTITTLRNEIDTVRSDSIKLYEKIKFLQGYQKTGGSGTVGGGGGGIGGGGGGEADEMLGRYSSEYEEHINPFKQFNKQEKQRKYMSMTALDKITFQLGRIVLGNKYGRLAFVIYASILHLLIFLVLYRLSHNEASKVGMAEICHHQFANHMHDVHHEELNENLFAGGTS